MKDYKAVFEAMPGAFTLLKADSPQFTIIASTDDFVESVGMSREKLYGFPLFKLFPANPEEELFTGEINLRTSLEFVLAQKTSHQLKVQRYDIPNTDGTFTVKYWQAHNKPMLNKSGEVVYIIHSTVDVTEKVMANQAQESIKLGDQTYHLFMQAPMAICILSGEELVVELANSRILELWRKNNTVVGKPLLEALPEISGTAFTQLLHQVKTTGKAHYENESHAYFVAAGREELVYFNFVYQPYYEGDNPVASGILVVANEVTEQVKARKIVEESEQQYRALISNAVVATAVYSGREMRIQYANEAMLRLWAKDDSAIGKTIREALPKLDEQPFHKLLEKVFTTGETYCGKEDKVEIILNDQMQTFYFNFTFKALRNAAGEIYGILNMAIDVTEQVLAQNELRENQFNLERVVAERTIQLKEKNQELEYSNQEFQQFAYIASHDLQEPLRKIRTYSKILSDQVAPDADIRKYVDKINGSAERMSGLINSLLDYSKLSKAGIRYEKVDLKKVLKDILADYELLIAQKNALVKFDRLPVIEAVPLQINQLFYNLVGNALKFTKRNVQPVISISCDVVNRNNKIHPLALDPDKKYYSITIRDNGIGFEQGYADKIFTIFQRLNDRSQHGGYGIGLALCKKVVHAHKGLIFAEGSLNNGAAFTAILPSKQ